MSKTTEDYDVVIVGAGPVGLALGIELGGRGVRCLIVERNERVGLAPRAKTTNVRTRTHLRRWGIAQQLAAASPFGVDYPSNVVFTTRLGGIELARFADAFNAAPARNPLYPEHAQWIPQYKLEEVLRAHVATLGTVELRFNTELDFFTQDGNQVHAGFRRVGGGAAAAESAGVAEGGVAAGGVAAGGATSVRARYLVGADGARSKVRELIGATLAGRHGLSYNYNIIFRAPGLAQLHVHGPAIFYWQVNADVPSALGPMDRDDIWYIGITGLPRDKRLSDLEARELICRATGISLPYEILSSDQWVASRLIANKYREGRVFLAGDACHLHPPYGGYGMNMGIGDGADLGWKLAAVLQGWGAERLLDSYEEERKPVHEWIMDEAEANHSVLGRELFQAGIEEDSAAGAELRRVVGENILRVKKREFHTLGAVLGYCYRGAFVMREDAQAAAAGTTAGADARAGGDAAGGDAAGAAVTADAGRYVPSSRPGCLAPHLWLTNGASLYDSFGQGFALLVRRSDHPDSARAREQAVELGIPLNIVLLPEDAPADLYPKALTLVRPDQHVGWRGDTWDPKALSLVTGKNVVESMEMV